MFSITLTQQNNQFQFNSVKWMQLDFKAKSYLNSSHLSFDLIHKLTFLSFVSYKNIISLKLYDSMTLENQSLLCK